MKTSSNAESIAEEFADRFEGLGRLSKVQVQIAAPKPNNADAVRLT